MKRKARLSGLVSLGARLKGLRTKAGFSQMQLAKMLGLNPKHGYKYILRLEKGVVPNPTIRTITGYLNACNATWQEIADVLSEITLTAPAPGADEQKPEPIVTHPYRPGKTPPVLLFSNHPADRVTTPDSGATEPNTREQFWQLVNKALDQGFEELRPLTISPRVRRLYHSFIRSACLLIARSPKDIEQQLAKLALQIEKQGADREILNRLQTICRQLFLPNN